MIFTIIASSLLVAELYLCGIKKLKYIEFLYDCMTTVLLLTFCMMLTILLIFEQRK